MEGDMAIFRRPSFMKQSVQSSGVVGSSSVTPTNVSAQSFGQRQHVERNRSMVGGYAHAKLGFRGHSSIRRSTPSSYVRPGQPSHVAGTQNPPRKQSIDGVIPRSVARKDVFHEPSSRHYNPYG